MTFTFRLQSFYISSTSTVSNLDLIIYADDITALLEGKNIESGIEKAEYVFDFTFS